MSDWSTLREKLARRVGMNLMSDVGKVFVRQNLHRRTGPLVPAQHGRTSVMSQPTPYPDGTTVTTPSCGPGVAEAAGRP